MSPRTIAIHAAVVLATVFVVNRVGNQIPQLNQLLRG